MELTGKAKEGFLKANGKKEAWINIMLPIYQQALIIEWFDSVEYDKISSLWDYCFYGCYRGLRDYKQATEQAIKKANEIYNERKY